MNSQGEKVVLDVIRNNTGGIGKSLPKELLDIIFDSQCQDNECEDNSKQFDERAFEEGLKTAFKNHPIEWVEIK